MASKDRPRSSGTLNNKTTRFSGFTWGEHEKLRKAIQKLREEMGGDLPARFKIKL